MEKNKKYSRIALSEIRETPANGTYLTNGELMKYAILAGTCLLLSVFAFFGRRFT